jgi:lambda family phage tail tape measure protein
LKVVLQTLGVVAVNTIYVLKQMGGEIGVWAAQLAALARFDFAGFKTIGKMWEEDSAKARIEVDKLSSSILGLTNSKAGAGRGGNSRTDPRSLGIGEDFKSQLTGLNGDGKGTKEVDEGLTLLNSLKTSYEALTKTEDEYDKIERQINAFKNKVTDDRKAELLGWAMLIQIQKDAIATQKLHLEAIEADVKRQDEQDKIIAKFTESTNASVDAIVAQTDALGLSSDELQRHNALAQIDIQVKKLSVGATADTIVKLQEMAAAMKGGVNIALDEQIKKQKELNASWEVGAKNALDEYQKNVANVASFTQNAFSNAFKGMEDALVNFVSTGKLDFSSLAQSIINDLIRIQIQQSVMKPLSSAFSAAGGISGLIDTGKKLLGFATGGTPPIGTPYMVGENGPEVRVDTGPGVILPNHSLGGGGGSVTVNQPIVINAPNAGPETVAQIQSMMPALIAQNKKVIEGVIQQAMARRGGRLAV